MSMVKRIISTLLAVLMISGAFTMMVSAADSTTKPVYTYNTKPEEPTLWYFSGKAAKKDKNGVDWVEDSASDVLVSTPQEKLAYMDLRYEKGDYRLYVDEYSGEVATECISTGEILFTNPYSVGQSESKDTVKKDLMSQLVVTFTEITTETQFVYDSYTWCAARGQMEVKPIKSGIRVEYSIGREEAKMLVPQLIKKESLEAIIATVEQGYIAADKADDWGFDYQKIFEAWYKPYDPSTIDPEDQVALNKMYKDQPITKKGIAVYALDSTATKKEKARIEQAIKTYCPTYTYEQLDQDHMEVEFVAKDENAPLFKMALEYTLDEYGMSVRLPANGIRFNETLYQLENISILPYMGAGKSPNEGYTFFPDGSGALFDFDDLYEEGTFTNISGKVYGGNDFAYHEITGTHQQIIRYPAFGLVEKETITEKLPVEEGDTTTGEETEPETFSYTKDRGYFAIVEEGDALLELATYHRMDVCEYHTVTMKVYPRPKDSYNVSDSISVGSNSTWTVVSSRKYTGNYKIRYIMLTGDEAAAKAEEKLSATGSKVPSYYETSYVGMAKAYREYLERMGILSRMKSTYVSEDIPLYIETFGAMETIEKILSIPVNVMTPLTTFEDITLMYDDLSASGIKNVNFIMTGYTDGGMTYPAVAYDLDWDKSVEKEMDFDELLEDANQNGYKVFPDFDFVFAGTNTLFDGLSLKKHAVKTIDGRYTSKREYTSTKQTYMSYFELAISPAYFSHFYERLTEEYSEYKANSISVSTLASYLNSDFDEDEPYNREDSKQFTKQAFQYIFAKYRNVLSEGGNAYSWKYVDYLTDVALDSSRYYDAYASVPFLGMVLHGYVEFAGTPINMEGNIDYALLKAIESGAGLKFILSYRNTENLKEDIILNQYYSIDYSIWHDQMIELYTELNGLLKGVQTSTIVHHEFINTATRIPDDDEIERDILEAIEEAKKLEAELAFKEQQEFNKIVTAARKSIENIDTNIKAHTSGTTGAYFSCTLIKNTVATLEGQITEFLKAKEENDMAKVPELQSAIVKTIQTLQAFIPNFVTQNALAEALYADAVEGYELIDSEKAYTENVRASLKAKLDTCISEMEIIRGYTPEVEAALALANSLAEQGGFRVTFELSAGTEDGTEGEGTEGEGTEGEGTEPGAPEAGVPGDNEPEEEETEVSKYLADTNKIVYEVYENGTAFLLNFNNYRVSVTLPANGITYVIEPYGYIVINS